TATKKERTVAVTTEDMQKRRNDVKARTTLLLALPDEHQLRFSKYKTAQELWAAILKTFGRNEATKKTKKNMLKQQYGNFKAEGSETLEQTFNRLQVIPCSRMAHAIMWRNRSDLDTMSVDDLYNHLKVYEPEVQKKSDSNSPNMAFISSSKNSSGNGEVNTASIPTVNTQVSPAGPNVAAANISLDTAYTGRRQGKRFLFKGLMWLALISQMWSALTATRWATLLGSAGHPEAKKGVEGWDWSFMANEEENHALVADEEAPTEFAVMAKSSYDNEVFDNSLCSKACKKNTDSHNSKITDLSDKLCDSETMLYHYKLDDTITDYSRPSPAIERNSGDLQNRIPSVTETEASSSTILSKPAINFVKSADRPTESKTDKVETAKKPAVKYAKMYRKTLKRSNVRGNQRNWNNMKS
nr:ribonuclease H-like domain-containing protein [Tanacetum cinerariifolium]